jgi:hypothetical protein
MMRSCLGLVFLVLVGCGISVTGDLAGGSDGGTDTSVAPDVSSQDVRSRGDVVDAKKKDSSNQGGKEAGSHEDVARMDTGVSSKPDVSAVEAGDAHVSDTGVDAGHDAGVDSGQHDAGTGDSGLCGEDAGACVASVDAGWTMVLYSPTESVTCPPMFSRMAVVSAVAQAGACACGAGETTTAPTCEDGNLSVTWGYSSCSNYGPQSVAGSGGACEPMWSRGTGEVHLNELEAAPLQPTGGACSSAGKPNTSDVMVTSGTVCSIPAGCDEGTCDNVPSGFHVCIEKSGTESVCPGSWNGDGSPIEIGTTYQLTCSSCGCSFTGEACSSEMFKFLPRQQNLWVSHGGSGRSPRA